MTILILLFSYAAVIYIIYQVIRNNPVSLRKSELFLVFSLKVLAAWAYGFLFLKYYNGDDTWLQFETSVKEKERLLNDPLRFIRTILPDFDIQNNISPAKKIKAILDHLEYAIMNKLPALFNLISRDNYYINCIFFSFITFWGHYWLFVFLTERFPAKRTILFIVSFLFPPALFWLSGFRSDGILFSALTLCLFSTDRFIRTKDWVYLLAAIAAFGLLFILRNQFALLLIPAVIAWVITISAKSHPAKVFFAVYLLCILLFFGSSLFQDMNLPAIVVKKQQEFFNLEANTRFHLDSLTANPVSYLKVLPQSVNNTMLRPYIWEAKGLLQLFAAAENIFMIVLFLVFLSNLNRINSGINKTIVYTLVFFCISLYLFIGYTVPFPGAIIRYRVMPELILLCLMAIYLPNRIIKSNI